VDNQDQLLCVSLLAVNNEVLENTQVFNVTITTADLAVQLARNTSSLVVFDDDSECAVIQ
jgi:hypothetical protein